MSESRTTSGLLLLVSLAVIGYMLVTLPGKLMQGFAQASQLGAWAGYVYLGVVGIGALILTWIIILILLRIRRATRAKRADRARRDMSPSQMSAAQKTQELSDNLAAGQEFVDGEHTSPQVRAEIEKALSELASKREASQLEIVAFGTISSGKSSLLNAVAGRDAFRTNVIGGTTTTRSEVTWPAAEKDRVILVDTPGLAEVRGETRAAEAAAAAKNADLVLFVVDGPLKSYERELLDALATTEKRIVVCLNKEDWYDAHERDELLKQLAEQVTPAVKAVDVVAVRSRPTTRYRVRVMSDGSEQSEEVPVEPDIAPLAKRMLSIVQRDGRELLLANLLLQSRGLLDDAKERALAALDARADDLISKYMWAAGSVAAVNPIPLLDLAGGSAITVKMVIELAAVYKQPIDSEAIVRLLGQLGKNLIAMVGASAASPALAAGVASVLKTVPGIGTIAGGFLQGVVQAVVTRWIGRIFCEYFRNEMQSPPGGMAELARREWEEVTRPDQLRKLIQLGRQQLTKGRD